MSKFAVGIFSELKCRFRAKSWKTEDAFSSSKRKSFLAKGYPEETLAISVMTGRDEKADELDGVAPYEAVAPSSDDVFSVVTGNLIRISNNFKYTGCFFYAENSKIEVNLYE